MEYISWILFGGALLFTYISSQNKKKESREAEYQLYRANRELLKERLLNWKDRENHTRFDNDRFWRNIEDTASLSSGSYKNQMGLLKDRFLKLPPEELIELDNLLADLEKKAFNWDLYGASYLLSGSDNMADFEIFISILIAKGEVYFKQVVNNIELLLNLSIEDMAPITLRGMVAEIYLQKSNSFIPRITEKTELSGEAWDIKDLPVRYAQIWDRI